MWAFPSFFCDLDLKYLYAYHGTAYLDIPRYMGLCVATVFLTCIWALVSKFCDMSKELNSLFYGQLLKQGFGSTP